MEEVVSMPIIVLRNLTVLPEMLIHFDVLTQKYIKALEVAIGGNLPVFLVTQKDDVTDSPTIDDVCSIGTISHIRQMIKMPGNMVRVLAAGENRGELLHFDSMEPYMTGTVQPLPEHSAEDLPVQEQRAMLRILRYTLEEYFSVSGSVGKDIAKQLRGMDSVDKLMTQIAITLPVTPTAKQQILEAEDIEERFETILAILSDEMEIGKIKQDFEEKVKQRVKKNQKEYLMREQLKVIREELGESSSIEDAERFLDELQKLEAPEEIKEKIKKEIERFKNISQSPAESSVSRTYIETLLSLPWNTKSEDYTDLCHAEKILNRDHYGLEKVKERILEFLAVRTLNQKGQSPIICLVGPPGTGKTSIARSVAEALHKKYVRICLGGVRDEAEIRGHRRTYIGAMPGRIVNGLKNAKVRNPLMLLDEIDKISSDFKGDTASALLEVLDPEQNSYFTDHYVELPMDLSEVLFICTANSTQTIAKPLLDRMELIEVSSYTINEKEHIAKEHLIRKQLEKNGLTKEELKFSKKAVEALIFGYTREAGVRELERKIGELCRKAAKEILIDKQNADENKDEKKTISITDKNLSTYLGKPKYHGTHNTKKPEVGVVCGLAWTQSGGDTLKIEVAVLPGKGAVTLTGNLGDVMKESAQTAISYVRSQSENLFPKESDTADFFEKHDIHIHVPEGAVPKDGPSAGITIATAVYSAISGKPVRGDIAMTGEISLRGRVMQIGGLKEKLLAAGKAGITCVIVPEENRNDVDELQTEVTNGIEIVFAAEMGTVLKRALTERK